MSEIISMLGLKQHPEGGFYKRIYTSTDMVTTVNPTCSKKERPCSTSIYYLLEKDEFSAWHRLKSDEQWHHYEGNPVDIYAIDPKTKELLHYKLGSILDHKSPHILIKRGFWFCAQSIGTETGSYSFVGCTVTPGFDFDNYELAVRLALISEYPEHRDMINRFTREKTDCARNNSTTIIQE